jgi:hypothetical protein
MAKGSSRIQSSDSPPILTHSQSSKIRKRRMHHIDTYGVQQMSQIEARA